MKSLLSRAAPYAAFTSLLTLYFYGAVFAFLRVW